MRIDGRTDRLTKLIVAFLGRRLQPDYERTDITMQQVCLDICYICDVRALTSLVRRSNFWTREAEWIKYIFIIFQVT